jgi:hypothetical protein
VLPRQGSPSRATHCKKKPAAPFTAAAGPSRTIAGTLDPGFADHAIPVPDGLTHYEAPLAFASPASARLPWPLSYTGEAARRMPAGTPGLCASYSLASAMH